MKFFNPLKRNAQIEAKAQESAEIEISKSVFVDEDAPQADHAPEGLLNEFLNRNYWSMGYSYGYKYRSAEILKNHIAKIQSDFIEVIDKRIQELDDVIDQIKQGHTRGKGISVEVDELYCEKLGQAQESVKTLINERDLVAVGQGKVAKSINDFRLGYNEGNLLAMEGNVLKLSVKV